MSISIIPAAPGIYAVTLDEKNREQFELVIAWQIEVVDKKDSEFFDDMTVIPIGCDDRITGAIRIVHGSE
jgi:hypothetical protein